MLGPLTRYMTPTLDAALLMCGSPEGGRATSSRAGADLGRTLDSCQRIVLKHIIEHINRPLLGLYYKSDN